MGPPEPGELDGYSRSLARGGRQLKRGRHGLSPEFVARAQRDRMIDAMAHAVADKGYGPVSVADVLALAGVSRRTFYETFNDKHHCFVASYEVVAGRMLREVGEGYASETAWPRRIAASVASLVDFFVREPAYARAGIIEVLAAGPDALKLRDETMHALQFGFDPGRPEVPDHGLPAVVAEATIGGLYEVMYSRILNHGPETLAQIKGDMVYLALAPYIGHKRAMRLAASDPAGAGATTQAQAATG